jgi:pyridoxamine 5'-phosphate oxidase
LLDPIISKLFAGEHLPDPLPPNPMPLFTDWFETGLRESNVQMPDAMALATATTDGAPSVRFVLCKRIEPAGAIHFFTNLSSRKSAELAANPRASGVFYWPARARQARVEGTVERLNDAQNDAYFQSRALTSKVGAWASRQSEPLASREQFAQDLIAACKHLQIDPAALLDAQLAVQVPRPPHWGGFRLMIERLELWCGGEGRLHDRAQWVRTMSAQTNDSTKTWRATRLYP